MLSRFLTAVIILSLSVTVCFAQRKVTPCGYIIPPKSLRTTFQSVYEAKQIVDNMLETIQWQQNFNLREQNGIQNAYATIANGERYIVYDNNFLEDIDSYARTKWASISIMAHEMGHHYYNHVVSREGSTVPKEIEADGFSGYMMAKLGASLEQAMAAMNAIGTPQQTSTHPAKSDRLTAIQRGWNAAKNQGGNGNGNPTPVPPIDPSVNTDQNPPINPGSQTDPQNDPSWIALTIQSNKDETVQLSDDGKTYQDASIKAGEPFIFKFEVYNWGWLKLPYYNGFRTFKLSHGKDYSILYNRRSKNWTVVEVPQ